MQLTNGMLGTLLISENGDCAGMPTVKIFGEQGLAKGSFSNLLDNDQNSLGAVLRTRERCKPFSFRWDTRWI